MRRASRLRYMALERAKWGRGGYRSSPSGAYADYYKELLQRWAKIHGPRFAMVWPARRYRPGTSAAHLGWCLLCDSFKEYAEVIKRIDATIESEPTSRAFRDMWSPNWFCNFSKGKAAFLLGGELFYVDGKKEVDRICELYLLWVSLGPNAVVDEILPTLSREAGLAA